MTKSSALRPMRMFYLVWAGQSLSAIGTHLTAFVLGFRVYRETDSVTLFALVSLVATLPGLLFLPLIGALVDRWDRRRVMLLSDVASGLVTLATVLLLLADRLEIWHIYLIVGCYAFFSTFQWPAFSAAITLLVPKERYMRVGGMMQAGAAAAQILAPLMAGVLLEDIGMAGVVAIDLATFLFSVAILLVVRFPRPEAASDAKPGTSSLWREGMYGWTYIKARAGLLGLLLFLTFVNFSTRMVVVLLTPLVLGFTSVASLGTVLSISGVGLLLGSLLVSVRNNSRHRIRWIFGPALVQALLLFLGGLQPSVALVAGAAFLFMFCSPFTASASQAIWQSKVPADVQGRVFSIRQMITTSSVPLAYLVAGPLADWVFEPLLAAGGPLAASVGPLVGTGPGRGIGLLFMVLGFLTVLVTIFFFLNPRVRRVDDELPDAIEGTVGQAAPGDRRQRHSYREGGQKMKRVLRALGIGFLVIALLAVAGGTWMVRRPWPQESGTLKVAGLSAPVRVLRDRWGVPHIYAENEPDLFLAQGYVHAQDRLWQMDLNRRVGSGTLSAAVGGPGVNTDRFMRTLGLRRAAEREWELLDADARAILEAYAAGVNAYIDSHRNALPVEYTILRIAPEPWTPLDTLVWGKVMGLSLGRNFASELLRARITAVRGGQAVQELFPPYAGGEALNIPPEVQNYSWIQASERAPSADLAEALLSPPPGVGSNSWVVHGSRTVSGKPLLANDTHLSLGMPSVWYLNGLHGGRFNSVGFSFPGVPLIIMGHNEQVAWGITNLYFDVQDLYVEKLDDKQHPTRYEFKGEWHDLEVIPEIIQVKGYGVITEEVRLTRHGPLLNEVYAMTNAEPLSIRWTILEDAGVFQGILGLNLASNWDSFRAALRSWGGPSQHFVYADQQGNIGYQAAGTVPVRPPGHQGLVPMPGWTGDYEWGDPIEFDQLASSFNPPEGFIATANNEIAPDDYPAKVGYEWDSYRNRRISEVLAANQRVTAEDVRSLQADTYSPPAADLLPYLLAVTPQDDLQTRALDQVKRWDMHTDVDQAAPSIFYVWYQFLLRNTLQDELGEGLADQYEAVYVFNVPFMLSVLPQAQAAWFDDTTTAPVETRDEIVGRSLADAVSWLRERYGDSPEQWTWGKLHTMTFRHQPFGVSRIGPLEWLFNSRTVAARGDNFTVNVGWADRSTFGMSGGVSQRLIVDLNDLDNTEAINSTGQSGHLLHRHREDMIPLWQGVEYVPLPFSRQRVQAGTEAELILEP